MLCFCVGFRFLSLDVVGLGECIIIAARKKKNLSPNVLILTFWWDLWFARIRNRFIFFKGRIGLAIL